ncbi:hypothetical protein [Clostridium tyrobutyricum]|uniref:hypothetical protein n=1 Tax=Clostridium tyrobutyricum TaxID=1519 RepID=UPI0011CA4F7C|nr:hypothetical protein [Clostridium tyrobutyricum]
MPRGKKIRRIDYNLKEMMDLCKISTRPTFNKQIEKLCKLYGFKKESFKIDNSETGDYYFPADFAEPLALLLRNYVNYPLNRSNAVQENIKATQIKEYNKIICDEIDNDLNDVFRKIIYTLPCHLQAVKISDLTSDLVERLTLFIVNITKLDHQEIGEVLNWLCRALDEANYNLFRGSYFKNKIIESNMAFCDEGYKKQREAIYGIKDNEIEELENEMMKSNNSIDYAVAILIKRIMQDTQSLNSADKGSEFLTSDDNDILKMMGLEISVKDDKNTCKDGDNFLERDLYYRSVVKQYLSLGKYKLAQSVIENYSEKVKKRKSIVEKIKDGTFQESCELSISTKRKVLEQNIKNMQHELEKLNEECSEGHDSEEDFLCQMKNEYVKYYDTVLKDSTKLKDEVDRFVGQIFINTLNTIK